jgi:hypothetical protein
MVHVMALRWSRVPMHYFALQRAPASADIMSARNFAPVTVPLSEVISSILAYSRVAMFMALLVTDAYVHVSFQGEERQLALSLQLPSYSRFRSLICIGQCGTFSRFYTGRVYMALSKFVASAPRQYHTVDAPKRLVCSGLSFAKRGRK